VGTHRIDKLVLSNVLGERLASPLRQWLAAQELQEAGPLSIEQVTAQAQAYGLRCAYTDPSRLGADRWAALVAARQYITGTCCVIDCGTALTIDVLSTDGQHEGGLIAPGMTMMRQSLQTNTVQIDAAESVSRSIFSVHDTVDAVQAGIIAAMAGTVQQVLAQCHERGWSDPICVVTGGNAQALLPVLPQGCVHEPDWVLKGLAIIAACHE
jgi:type III pantothenate kinase